jgi:hypothetical protein
MRGGILAMCELHKLDASFKTSHGFTFQNAKKASRTHNTFKLAAAQIFTYYHAFTGHQYTSKKGGKGRW